MGQTPMRRMNDTAPSHPPIIETRGLTRRFQSGDKQITVLDDVTLCVARGEFVAIMGKSGSGKSTLLALLAGLDRPSAGGVSIDGEAIETMSEDKLALLRRRKVGFVFQSFHLLGNFTALDNVMLPVELLGIKNARERATELLDRVGLAGRGHHYPTQLSGGEQQRVALARAFAPDPAARLGVVQELREALRIDLTRARRQFQQRLIRHARAAADQRGAIQPVQRKENGNWRTCTSIRRTSAGRSRSCTTPPPTPRRPARSVTRTTGTWWRFRTSPTSRRRGAGPRRSAGD
jgi:putative ABC transport system ATP-binding protein